MKILLIADGRSPITERWIQSVKQLNHQIYLVSTYPCKAPEGVDGFTVIPVAFAKYSGSQTRKSAGKDGGGSGTAKRGLIKRFRALFMLARYILGPFTVIGAWRTLRRVTAEVSPDLVHALRIPFEGMLAAGIPRGIPLAVSIWGNDLTLHGKGSLMMRLLTKWTLKRTNGLMADTARDIRLARQWGLDSAKPVLEVPGNGGVSLSDIRTTARDGENSLHWLPSDRPVVINPRGFRPGSVRNDTFFKSIPLILSQYPDTLFLCCSMANQPEALDWVERLRVEKSVILLPTLKQSDLWPLFSRADVTVTVSQHDGTPNSLLEAMSLGCFPVAGDIESMREWITPGINGMLVNPDNPEDLARAVVSVIRHPELRAKAGALNEDIIRSRAEISAVAPKVDVFYREVKNGNL